MQIHLIHGIHTSEGDHNVAQLLPYIQNATGKDVEYHSYGYALALTTRLWNPSRTRDFVASTNDGDVCIGHSNGCSIIYEAMRSRNYRGVVFINPALDQDVAFPNSLLKFVHVYFNKYDEAVPLTEMPILKQFLFDNSWGEMGKFGYNGKPDARVCNINCSATPNMVEIKGHSDIFTPDHLKQWGPYIGGKIKNELDTA